jgi:hypothetical protein
MKVELAGGPAPILAGVDDDEQGEVMCDEVRHVDGT